VKCRSVLGFAVPVALALVVASSGAAQSPAAGADQLGELVGSDGRSFNWQEWLDDNGPAVVLVWSTWAPRSSEALEQLAGISAACRDRDLDLIVVDVQEEIEDARAVLGDRGVLWVNDRHGAMLKRMRVIRVPAVLIVDPRQGVVGRLDLDPEAVRAWRPEP